MEIYRLGIKFFVADPASVTPSDFVGIFHGWIQNQNVKDHLLIDVHDYSHIHQGPGMLLVAHEGNFSIDSTDGRFGLLYYRKQPTAGTDEERFAGVVKTALQACGLIEEEPTLKGRVRFLRNELLIFANDRLNAPNNDETFVALQPVLLSALKRAFGESDFKLARVSADPKERLTIRASIP